MVKRKLPVNLEVEIKEEHAPSVLVTLKQTSISEPPTSSMTVSDSSQQPSGGRKVQINRPSPRPKWMTRPSSIEHYLQENNVYVFGNVHIEILPEDGAKPKAKAVKPEPQSSMLDSMFDQLLAETKLEEQPV